MVKHSLSRLPARNIQFLKRTTEHRYLIDSQPVPCLRLQIIQNLHGRHPFASLLFFRRTEITMEQLFQRDYLVTMDAAEKEGIKKGMEEGLKKGREEALNIFQTAIDMKKQGIDNQLIAEKTGLPLSLIESLK